MAKIRSLSKSSLIEVQRLRDEVHALRRARSVDKPVPIVGPAHYIVRTPSAGIPAATGTPLIPGEADCTIHVRRGTNPGKAVETTGRPQTVYNLSTSAVPGDTFIIVHRDAWGDFWAGEAVGCPDIGLAPGSYPGVAGAAIAAGASGSVVYDGDAYEAINQSECPVRFGDRVGLYVSPNCEAFFVPCVCDCDPPPEDCCEKPYSICIGGKVHILRPTGLVSDSKTWTACCEGAPNVYTFSGYLRCDTETNAIYFVFRVGPFAGGVGEGEIELTDLCANGFASEVIDLNEIIEAPCEVTVTASDELIDCNLNQCGGTEPPSECCDQSLHFCINEVSKEMPLIGGDETFDVTACCNCPGGASLQLTTTCVNGNPFLGYFYQCAEITGSGNISLADFCFGATGRILTIMEPCFLQIQVTTTETACAECLFTPTTGTEEPPPIDP